MNMLHYLNQFFGGIGGEDVNDLPLETREGALGPGRLLDQKLGDRGSVVATVIAGDNYFVEEEDVYEITLAPENLADLKHHLESKEFNVTGAEITNIPSETAKIAGETARKVLNLMESLEDHDDIQTLSSNFDMDETVIAEVQ